MEQTIPLMVESDQGSIKTEVQKEDIPDKVKDELKDDKWVTLENEDGSTETLTKSDLPSEEEEEEGLSDEDKKLQDGWKSSFTGKQASTPTSAIKPTPSSYIKKFDELKSVTSTYKDKGG